MCQKSAKRPTVFREDNAQQSGKPQTSQDNSTARGHSHGSFNPVFSPNSQSLSRQLEFRFLLEEREGKRPLLLNVKNLNGAFVTIGQ